MAEYIKEYRHPLYVRITHGVHALSMIMLILTGLEIALPSYVRIFETISMARYIHFLAAWLIIWCYVSRAYYYFFVTKKAWDIMVRPKDFIDFFKLLKYYLWGMFVHAPKPYFGKYNPGQKIAYSIWPLVFIPQFLTGFALYEPEMFQIVVDWFSGLGYVRYWHFILTVFYLISLLAHIYLGSTGVTIKDYYLSMITGYETKKREA